MAIEIANKNKNIITKDFDKYKNNAMLNALRAKFSQYPDLGDNLMDTKNRQLIEHNLYDNYWSDGGDGSGKNTFGNLLMEVRTELQNGSLTYNNPFKG